MDKFRFGIRFLRFLFCGVLLITLAGCFGVVGTGYDGPGYYGPGYFDDYGPDVTILAVGRIGATIAISVAAVLRAGVPLATADISGAAAMLAEVLPVGAGTEAAVAIVK